MSEKQRYRCAIYTRKSTEEGLEQEFNSLDAQREACSAYVKSQASLGWRQIAEHYDDGGISGGTMERPALQRLLADIAAGKVDIVVVYKIDRLTRSLIDFSRIVEIFDSRSASFVSVTQQFNTTTSMGRLMLNVLLSFAQFEREVTAERIRDKVAASKKRGMWMGGTVPLGYCVENKKLMIEDDAATEVRRLFRRYLEIGSVPALARELNDESVTAGAVPSLLHADTGQGRRPPTKKVGKGKLYYILSNPIYTGRIRHRGAIHQGEHDAIIDDDLFEAVQARLAEQAPRERGKAVQRDIHLLNGLLFDETGDRLSPIHGSKAGKRYRYYISSRLKASVAARGDGWRIPAADIEAIVVQQLAALLSNKPHLSNWLQQAAQGARIEEGLEKAAISFRALGGTAMPLSKLREIVGIAIRRIDLDRERIRISIDSARLAAWLVGDAIELAKSGASSARLTSRRTVERGAALSLPRSDEQLYILDLPLSIRRRGVERRLLIEGAAVPVPRLDQPLIDAIARAHAYLEMLTNCEGCTRKDVATRFGVHPEDVSRLLPLAFLSPRIVDAILTGQQPVDLSVQHLTRNIELPVIWADQARTLGI